MKGKHRDRRRFGLSWVSLMVILAMLTPVFSAFAEGIEEETTFDAEYEVYEDTSDGDYDDETSYIEAEYEVVEEEAPFQIGETASESNTSVKNVTSGSDYRPSEMGNGDYRPEEGNGDYRPETADTAPQAPADQGGENANPEADPNAAAQDQATNWNETTGSLEDVGDAVIVGFKVNHSNFELAAKPDLNVALDYLAETVKVRAILSTGDEVNVAATWSCDDEAAYAVHDIGAFPFTGWVESATTPIADGVEMPYVVLYVKYISEIKVEGDTQITVEGEPTGSVADMPNALGFPTTVTATVEGAETESVTIPVSWVCADEGDGSGEYLFTAQLDGEVPYLMEESVTMPAMLATFDLTRASEPDGYKKVVNDDGSYDLFVTGKVCLKGAKIMKSVASHIDSEDSDENTYNDVVLEDLGKISSIVVEDGAELTMIGSFTLRKNIIVESGGVLNIGYREDSYDADDNVLYYGTLYMTLTNYGTIEVESSGRIYNYDKVVNGKVSNGKGRAGTIVIDGFFYNYGEVYTCYRNSRIVPSPDAIIYKSTKENVHFNDGDDGEGLDNTDYREYDAGDSGYYGFDGTYRVREVHRWSPDGTCMYCGMRRVELDIRIEGNRLDKIYDGKSYVELPGGVFTNEENDNGYMSVHNIKNGDEVTIGKFKATYHFGKLDDQYPSDEVTVSGLLNESQTPFANSNTVATEIQDWLTTDTAAMMAGVGRDNWWVYLNIWEDDISYDSNLYVYTYNRARHDAIPGIIYPRNINDPAVTVKDIEDQTYDDGKAIEPEVTVTSKFDGKLVQADNDDILLGDYTLTFANNKKATKKAEAIITGIGNYTGTRIEHFKIKKEGGGGSSSSEEEDDEEEKPVGPKPGELYFDALDGSDRVVNLGYVLFDDFSHPYSGYVHSEDPIVSNASLSMGISEDGFEEEPEEGEGYGALPETGYYRLTITANPVTDPITGVATTLTEDPSREKYALLHLRLSPAQIDKLRQERITEVVYVLENSELRIPLSTLNDQIDIAPIKRAQQQNTESQDEVWGDESEEEPSEDDDEFEDEEAEPVEDDTELLPEMIYVTNYVFTINQLEKAALSPRENNALQDRKELLPLYRVGADVYDQLLPVVELQTATTTSTDDSDDEDEDEDTSDTLTSSTDLSAIPMPQGYPVLSELQNLELRVKGDINIEDIQTFIDEADEALDDEDEIEGEDEIEDEDEMIDESDEFDEDDSAETLTELPENVKGMIVVDSVSVMDEDAVELLEHPDYQEDSENYTHYVSFTPNKSGMYAVVLDMTEEEEPEEPEFETEADDIEEYYAYNREVPEEGMQYWLFDTEAKIVEYYDGITDTYMSGDYTGTIIGGLDITWENDETAEAAMKFEEDYEYVEMTQSAEGEEAEPILLTLVADPGEVSAIMEEHR